MKKAGIPFLIVMLIFSLVSSMFPSYANAAPAASITNINGAQGTISVTDVDVEQLVTVYDDNNTKLAEEPSNANGEAVLNFIFPTSDGTLTVVAQVNGVETEVAALPYSGVDISTPPQPSAIISDIDDDQGTVTVTNVAAGQTVRVYSDANVQLAEETANANGTAVLGFTFPTSNGELSVRTVANGTETEIAVLPYSGVVIPAPSPTADLTDINGATGVIIVSGLIQGDVAKVYDNNNSLLGTQSAGSNGEATLEFTFTSADGELTVTYVRQGTETNIVKLPYSGVDIPTSPQPAAIISDIDGDQGTVTVTNVIAGQTVRVYSDANVQLAEETANANGTAVLGFTFPTSNGELSVRTVANGTETEIAVLPYSGIVIPAPSPIADLTDINGATGVIKASGLTQGDIIKVYGPNNELLATQTVGTNGEVEVTFTFTSSDGDLTVTYTRQGTETNIVTLPYSGVDIPTPPQPSAIISDIDGAQGTITVTNVIAGQIVRVYSDANVQLAEETANANGTAVLGFTFPTSSGELSVRTVANGTETEIAVLPYSDVVIPVTPEPETPTAVLSNVNGSQGIVTVTNVSEGQLIRIYNDSGIRVAETPANTEGKAELAFVFPSVRGSLSVRIVNNDVEKEIAQLAYSGIVFPVPTPVDPVPNPPVFVPITENPVTPAPTPVPTPVDPPAISPPVEPQPTPSGPIRVSLTMQNIPVFSDTNSHWAQTDIQRLQSLGVLTGVGNGQFAPQEVLTRAQFVQMISNLLKLDPSGAPYRYSDVPGDAWYLDAVRAASAAGIVSGYTDDSFKPNRLVTREEMVHMIGNAIRYLDSNAPLLANANDVQSLSSFRDASSVGGWARENLTLAVNAGLVQGKSNGSLSPKSNTTRAEAAVVLSRVIDRMNDYFEID